MAQVSSRLIRIGGIAVALLVAPAVAGMLPTVLIWGVAPAIIGLALLCLSVRSIVLRFSAAQVALGVPTISLLAVSLWILKRVFVDGAWPTYLPYYGIAVAVPLVLVQMRLARAQ